MDAQFLTERLLPSETELVCESTQDQAGNKNLWLSGIFMQSEVRNRNGRIYPLSEMTRIVEEASSVIKDCNGIFGELDHPESLTINLQNVSHAITELRMSGNNVIGKARIIESAPMGAIAKALLESGVRFGVSSRATGALNENKIVSSMNFITADLVATPSAAGAMPEAIYESLHLDKNGYRAISLAEQVRHDEAAQKYLVEEIRKFVAKVYSAK